MSYGPELKNLLGQSFGGRVYPDTAPDEPPQQAYVIYQRVGGVPVYYNEGGMPDRVNARVQIHVWSNSKQDTYNGMVSVLQKVTNHPYMQVLSQPIDDYVQELRIYGSRVDISMWYKLT